MYEKIKAYVKEQGMLAQRDTVIAGISGGADSICLLCVLLELKKDYDLKIVGVHVNHGLRGEAALMDQRYVEGFCGELGVPLCVYHTDVAALAKEEGLSEEEAGRAARRRAFEETAAAQAGKAPPDGATERSGHVKIALAHHKNDNVETFFMNVARGTGLRGLGGIRPVNGAYIRPLLDTTREEIENFLEKKGISYCMDATNEADTYTRNRIRRHVIPYMEKEINEKLADHVCGAMEQMRKLWEYVDAQTETIFPSCVYYESSEENKRAALIKEAAFLETPEALRPYIIRRALVGLTGALRDIETVHVEDIQKLFQKQAGRYICLPYDLKAKRCYEGVRLFREGREKTGEPAGKKPEVSLRIFTREEIREPIPYTPYRKWFDYDIIKNSVEIRTRQPGDYIAIDREGRTQKLKRYFINGKIPEEERNKVWLAADGDEIMWVIGYRQSQKYQITENTRKILEISIYGGEEDGRDRKSIST